MHRILSAVCFFVLIAGAVRVAEIGQPRGDNAIEDELTQHHIERHDQSRERTDERDSGRRCAKLGQVAGHSRPDAPGEGHRLLNALYPQSA